MPRRGDPSWSPGAGTTQFGIASSQRGDPRWAGDANDRGIDAGQPRAIGPTRVHGCGFTRQQRGGWKVSNVGLLYLTPAKIGRWQRFAFRSIVIQSTQITDYLINERRIDSYADTNGDISSPQPEPLRSGTK